MITGWLVAGVLLVVVGLLAVRHQRLAARLADRNRLATDIARHAEAEATMRDAKELAESAARVKADFFANMSHEIRTPMNAVIGLSNLLLKTELTQHQRGYLAKIQQAAQMLLDIVNDILDFSKLEAGKLAFERTEFEPDEILDRVGNLIGSRAAAKGIELIFNVDPRLDFTLVGDPLRLSQIFVNYVGNAVKFTEHGEVEVIVEVKEAGPRDVLLYCAVRDSGPGLSEAQRARLFQPFEQADSSVTRRFGGTGLGLVICKSLAEAMGGEVGVESREGAGSTFWFTARLGRGTAGAMAAVPPDLRGLPVLVVDDHRRTREIVGQLLHGRGFAVALAASGREAVAAVANAAASNPFAVVLIDLEMADLDGFETAAEINAMRLDPSPRLILTIGAWGEEVSDEARQVGVEYLLPKPFTPSLLLNIISHALHDPVGGPRPAPEPEAAPPAAAEPALRMGWAGRRVLLVEDNDLNQEVAIGLLGEFGLAVDLAADGAVAVGQIMAHDPQYYAAVLMDMQMPVMDGLSATRAIRDAPAYDELPIIAMTANAMAQDRARCLAAGMNDHVAKPIEPARLREALVRWIGDPGDAPVPPLLAPLAAPPLPPIAGLDIASGLRRMMGNAAGYLALLHKFAEQQRSVPNDIAAALRRRDRATAERLAHTLKGIAGTIGAEALAAAAGRVEAALRAGADGAAVEPQLAALGAALRALLDELRRGLPPLAPPGPAAAGTRTADRAGAAEASRQLARLLADSDVAARAFLSDNAAALRLTLGRHFGEIEAAAAGFDFAAALAALRRAASELEIAL